MVTIQSLEEKRVDGRILCSSRPEEERLVNVLASLPAVVLINRRLQQIGEDTFDSVILDDERGGWMGTQHSIRSGHRHISFLAGPPGRRRGFLSALQEAGIELVEGWISHCHSVKGGYEAACNLLSSYPELTALFCLNDLVAVGARQACDELKRRVPEDLAIVGHDDMPLAARVSPAFTTCRVPRDVPGAKAGNALLERLRDCPGECNQIVLQPELVIRESAPQDR